MVNEAVTFLENLPKAVMNLKDIVIVKGRDHVYDWQFDPAMGEHMHMYGHLFGDSVRKSHKLGMADYLPSDLSTFSAIRTAVRPNNVFYCQHHRYGRGRLFAAPTARCLKRNSWPAPTR